MKKTVIILLIVIALTIVLGVFFYIESNNEQIFIGEVAFVRYREIDKYDLCYVYLKPVFNPDREELIMFEISKKTLFDSEFSGVLGSYPELLEGNVVKVTFNKSILDDSKIIKATSICTVDYTTGVTDELPLIDKKSFSFDRAPLGITVFGKIVHIAKVESLPLNGYIVYLEEQPNAPLTAFWVDKNTLIGTGVDKMLSNKETGYTIEIKRLDDSPFKNSTPIILAAFSINILSNE